MIKKVFLKPIFKCFLLLLILFTCLSAKRGTKCKSRPLPLTSIHIIDRNGLSETISGKDRLCQFQMIDFLKSQPYQKVLRIYARDVNGDIRSVVTTYYENGNIKQFLEIVNGRAKGTYCEWHENGVMNLRATIIGGTPDVTPLAEKTWLFDGYSYAWDENGCLISQIMYSQGFLEGVSIYYHENGKVWKKVPYCKGKIEGLFEVFKKDGEVFEKINYCNGKKHGAAIRYWNSENIASQENYSCGNLIFGKYYDQCENLVAEIVNGKGHRAGFGKEYIRELQEYNNGVVDGEVKVFNQEGRLKRVYRVKNGIKHGEETEYYVENQIYCPGSLKPKLSFNWYEGKVHGVMRTWYPNGVMENQREISNNQKSGILTAWYKDGNIMLIEEYESDKLIRGDYFKKGDRISVSQILNGKGVATIFDPEGHFKQKINYTNGKPEL